MANFHPDTSGQRWSLVQVHLFSPAVRREGHCRQISLACVGSTCSVPATLGLARLTARVLSRLHCSSSRLLYRERALSCVQFQFSGTPQKCRLGWACSLCLPRPQQLRQPGAGGAHSARCMAPSPFRGPSLSFRASRLGVPCVCSGELVCSCDPPSRCQPPESQEVFGWKLKAYLQFGRGCHLWG